MVRRPGNADGLELEVRGSDRDAGQVLTGIVEVRAGQQTGYRVRDATVTLALGTIRLVGNQPGVARAALFLSRFSSRAR
jgi:hypothetical protein